MAYYQIINWKRYQHYKHRSPAWIKLYVDLISSETWVMGNDASRALAIACMLLASRTENQIPADPQYIRKVCYLNGDPDFSHLIKTNFIALMGGDASEVLADCKHDASNLLSQSRVEESRVETPIDRKPRATRSDVLSVHMRESFDLFWEKYPRRIGKGAAERSWDKIHPDDDLAKKIIEAVETQKSCEQWIKDKGQFIPYPSTWLNQKRWEDDLNVKLAARPWRPEDARS